MTSQAELTTAMVLAAGMGRRMRPLTDTMPKPMVSVAGRTLIDRGLDVLVAANVRTAVVNIHYRPEALVDHLKRRDDLRIVFSDERETLLDSGGGIYHALGALGSDPFFILNADTFWLEKNASNLKSMAASWDPERMDIQLLLTAPERATGHTSVMEGDFSIDSGGRLKRHVKGQPQPMIYAGAGILHPRIFAGEDGGKFSLNRMFDRAIEEGRLFGHALDGHWITVGTPEAIGLAETAMEDFYAAKHADVG